VPPFVRCFWRLELVSLSMMQIPPVRPPHAAWNGHSKVVAVLLRAGADVNAHNHSSKKYTPLMAAARFGHVKVVRTLLDAEADPSMETHFGETALSLALHGQHGAVCELLGGSAKGVDWSSGIGRHRLGSEEHRQARRAFEAAVAGCC